MLNAVSVARRTLAKPPPKALADAYEAIFEALSHPARRHILMTLNFEGGEMSAGAIAGLFEHSAGERVIDLTVNRPVARHEYGPGENVMTKRPKSRIR